MVVFLHEIPPPEEQVEAIDVSRKTNSFGAVDGKAMTLSGAARKKRLVYQIIVRTMSSVRFL